MGGKLKTTHSRQTINITDGFLIVGRKAGQETGTS